MIFLYFSILNQNLASTRPKFHLFFISNRPRLMRCFSLQFFTSFFIQKIINLFCFYIIAIFWLDVKLSQIVLVFFLLFSSPSSGLPKSFFFSSLCNFHESFAFQTEKRNPGKTFLVDVNLFFSLELCRCIVSGIKRGEKKKKMRNDLHNTIKMCIMLRLRIDRIKSFLQTLIRIICAFIVIVDPHSLKHMQSSRQKAFFFPSNHQNFAGVGGKIFHGRIKATK